MSIGLGQHTVKVDAFVAGTTTSAINTTPGSTFVIFCASTFTGLTFSDNYGNNYTPTLVSQQYNGTFRTGYMAYVQNGAGGSGHTFSCAGGGSDSFVLFAVELTAAALSGGADANTTPGNVGGAPLVMQAVTPVSSNALVLNFAAIINATTVTDNAAGGSGGFTIVDSGEESSFGTGGVVSYKLVAAPAANSDAFTVTDSSQAATFAAAFASGGGVPSQGDQLTNQTFMSMSRGFR